MTKAPSVSFLTEGASGFVAGTGFESPLSLGTELGILPC